MITLMKFAITIVFGIAMYFLGGLLLMVSLYYAHSHDAIVPSLSYLACVWLTFGLTATIVVAIASYELAEEIRDM